MTKPSSADSPEKQLMTRNEGRKLFVMAVVLITMVVYLFKSGFKTDDPNQGGVPINLPGIGMTSEPHELPTQDPVKVRDALLRSEDAKKSGAKPPAEFQFDPKILQTVIEGNEEGKGLNLVEEPALYHLAAFVHNMSDEELANAHKTHGTWTWASLRSPEGRVAARGKFRRLQGRFLIPLTQRVLETYPNEAGLVWVWQGILRVQNRGYFVTITDKNFEPEIGPAGTIVEVDAAFLKGHAYESRRGIVQLPHVIVKKFHKVAPPKQWDYMNSELIWGAVVAFFVAAIMMVFYARRSKASAAQFEDWRQRRLASKKAGSPKPAKAQPASAAAPAEVAPGVAQPVAATAAALAPADPEGPPAETETEGTTPAEAQPEGTLAEAGTPAEAQTEAVTEATPAETAATPADAIPAEAEATPAEATSAEATPAEAEGPSTEPESEAGPAEEPSPAPGGAEAAEGPPPQV